MVDNKNKGPGEFDDDAFDVEEFSDADFDEAAYDESAEFDELPETEGDYEGDDFESEDWGDEEEEQDNGKKDKKAKKPRGEGKGLSFNAMVMIGAFVVGGGVLAFNVFNKTNEMKAAQPSFFRSILNIGGIMDGTIFGDSTEETAQEQSQPQESNQGFLNNPGSVPATPDGTPPQPNPISPTDGSVAANEPLTPMPVPPSAEAPRGPDDMPPPEMTPPTAEAVPGAPPSAEDILKQAMANREQRQQGQEVVASAPIDEAVPEPTPIPVPTVPVPEEPVAEAPKPQETPPPPAATPVVEPAPIKEAVVPVETQQEIAANKEAVTALEDRIGTLLKRMDQIETDLGTVRESKQNNTGNTNELEKTVAALRSEIEALKSRPVPASEPAPKPKAAKKKPVVEDEPEEVVAEEKPAPAKKAAAPKPKAPRAAASAAGTWELRAAQPGRAWVSKPGERDMKAVSVGESLAGIGRITAITYQNGRWTVAGTQGAIQQ